MDWMLVFMIALGSFFGLIGSFLAVAIVIGLIDWHDNRKKETKDLATLSQDIQRMTAEVRGLRADPGPQYDESEELQDMASPDLPSVQDPKTPPLPDLEPARSRLDLINDAASEVETV